MVVPSIDLFSGQGRLAHFTRHTMDSMGFIFGMMGFSMGTLGFIFGASASNNANAATGKVDDLLRRLNEAGILNDDEKLE